MGLPSREKFDDIFSCVDTIHQRDGRTDTGRQQRQRLRIASRGNKSEDLSLSSGVATPDDRHPGSSLALSLDISDGSFLFACLLT